MIRMASVLVKAVRLFQAFFVVLLLEGGGFAEQDPRLRIKVINPLDFRSDPEALVLHRDKANNFRESHGRRRRDLWEECYDEGCSKEEVEEVVSGHALYQYYYGWRCKQLYGNDWTYSGNPHSLQCSNILRGVKVCENGFVGISRSHSRNCYFGSAKNVYAVYMENGCNDGELGNWKLTFNDPSRSVRYVYNVGCRDRENFATVRGATMYTATLTGGGGGDGRISNYKLGWFGHNSKDCGHPGTPANGNLIGSNFFEMSQVRYTCRYGYTRVGNERRTCQWYGWDGSRPVCKRLCDPGTYSSKGYEPCSPCPIGKYQPNRRSTSCIACPGGKSTETTGKRFLSDCHHKCSKAVCHLQSWSQWTNSDSPYENQCASQIRTRVYTKTWEEILDPNGCNSVKKTCPSDQFERKQRVVFCDPLPEPEYGYYLPKNCTTNKQACKSVSSSVCMFFCGKGFQRQGTDSDLRRICRANGAWTTSSAKCKDTKAPEITCPPSIEVGNEKGKAFARVKLSDATATDNSGKTPSIKIASPGITALQMFPISQTPHRVYYSATDDAGLTSKCSFTVTVKDTEKPEVLQCPKEHIVYSKERPTRVVFPEPKFQDNYDTTPAITSSHKPGFLFYWKTYTLSFSARDKAGNIANCSYPLQVGPLMCPLYDPPENGIRSCNIKVNGARQEYVCIVQCNENYDFDEEPIWPSYMCMSGVWHGYKFPDYQPLPEGRPWKNCAVKSPPTGVAKKVKVYAGSCVSGNEETRKNIKEKFLAAVRNDPLLSGMFSCFGNNNVECQLSNVKVYCGKNSKRKKRGLDENAYVIDVEMRVIDLSPVSESFEKQKLKDIANKMLGKKQVVDDAIKRAASTVMKVQEDTIDVEDEDVKGACALGKVVVVKKGSGSGLDRSVCVDCSVGTYYSTDAEACLPCTNGTYQDTEGQVYCKSCPDWTNTVGRGAKSLKDCKGICRDGHYSATGLETCVACPVGKYQPNNHSTSCVLCPIGTSTLHVGTTTQEDCKKFCTAGYFSKDGGLGACLPCPRGTYQPKAKATSCIKCPSGMTTVNDGSTSQDHCRSDCAVDFENGIDRWTKTGTAFNNQPTYGDNPTARNRGQPAQQQGDWWIGTYENRPSPSHQAGQYQGDHPTGTLTSPAFQITGQSLSFLIGGGCDATKERAELLVEDQVVKTESGKCHESMERRYWDVRGYQGKMAQVRLVDVGSGSWGHINFDDLRGDFCV